MKLLAIIQRLKCFFGGHPCKPTGRSAILLQEWKCKRCGGLYVSHSDHGPALLSADEESDRIFRDFADAISTGALK